MRCVADEGDACSVRPGLADGEHVEVSWGDGRGCGGLREGDERGVPVVVVLSTGGFYCVAVEDVVAACGLPVGGADGPGADVDAAVAHLLGHDGFAVGEGEEAAAVDEGGEFGNGVGGVGDGEGVACYAGVEGFRVGEERAGFGPGSVCAYDEVVAVLSGSVREGESEG